MKLLFWKKRDESTCKWDGICKCHSTNKERRCDKCDFYWWVDSGFGYCRALPEFVVVAWCRDVCSFYKRGGN